MCHLAAPRWQRSLPGPITAGLLLLLVACCVSCVHEIGDWSKRVDPTAVPTRDMSAAADTTAEITTATQRRGPESVTIIAWSRSLEDTPGARAGGSRVHGTTRARLDAIQRRVHGLRSQGEFVVTIELPTHAAPPAEPRRGQKARARARARRCAPTADPLRDRQSRTPTASAMLRSEGGPSDRLADIVLGRGPWNECGREDPTDAERGAAHLHLTRQHGLVRADDVRPQGAPDGSSQATNSDAEDVLLEIVVLDLRAWLDAPVRGEPDRTGQLFVRRRRAAPREPSATLESLRRKQIELLRALPPRDSAQGPAAFERPPRVLVLAAPVESPVASGQGGYQPIGTFRQLPQDLQDALIAGAFDGVIAGHDASASAVNDLSDAITRSAKAWTTLSFFQLTSGSIERGATAAERQGMYEGIALTPDALALRPAFVEVQLYGGLFDLRVWSQRGGRWRLADLGPQMLADPRGQEVRAPHQVPCKRCVPELGAADGRIEQPY